MQRRHSPARTAATSGAAFGELLRHLREWAALTQEELAGSIPCDRSLVARIEAGSRVPQQRFAETCDRLLDTGGPFAHLWQRIDWHPQVEHPDWCKRRAAMDAEAVAIHVYEEQRMPGLLQTPEYSRALCARREENAAVLEERTLARLSRQQRFLQVDGPLLVAVLDESSLRTVVGSHDIMRAQCVHLLEMGQRPTIRIQVTPFDSERAVRPRVPMSLITMPDGHRWVYSESLGSWPSVRRSTGRQQAPANIRCATSGCSVSSRVRLVHPPRHERLRPA